MGRMFSFLILWPVLFGQSHGALGDEWLVGYDSMDLFHRLQKMESNMLKIKDDLEGLMAKVEVEDPELEDRVAKLEDLAKIGTLRSCYEYSQYGLKINGLYLIDPDGGLIGQAPFQVYCNFKTGATEVMHDTEDLTDVEHCHDPGCYQRNITYINGLTQEGVSMYQIISLIELAAYCEQEIQYDCTLAPLTAEDVNYAYWEDRQGETNIYYTGSNYGTHMCDCHNEAEGCIEEETKHNTCNCDANLPIPSTDTGTITNMTALPVMKLFFGGLNYDLQSAAYQLGRLKCYGDKDVDIATSCAALKKKGIMTSGYYNIKPEGDTHTKLVYCDMKSGTYTNVPQVDEVSNASPLGTILAWVPKPETSQTVEALPNGWLPCDGSTITKGPWTGGKTPDLNSIGAFLRGGTEANILEVESDQVQDHQHEDPGHQHDCHASATASDHFHNLAWHDPSRNSQNWCQSTAIWDQHCVSEASMTPEAVHTQKTYGLTVSADCSITSKSSGIGGVDSSSRSGTETRPINMKVFYVMRCW